MVLSPYQAVDTPALLIDRERAMDNLQAMQRRADRMGVLLRPHIKTHRMAYFARLQVQAGACGIACAKTGEAEVMAQAGLRDIFIANEIVGLSKLERVRRLHQQVELCIGVDSPFQIGQIAQVFAGESRPLAVMVEYEVGEKRSGVVEDEQLFALGRAIAACPQVRLAGIFSHEGHTYQAKDLDECARLAAESHRRTLRAAELLRGMGLRCPRVSVGATPALLGGDVPPGVTELRVGTYLLMDAGQAMAAGSFDRCAATVLATVISKPTASRVVLDAGAKALAAQNRAQGICATGGFGCVKGAPGVRLSGLYDEHGLIEDAAFSAQVSVGDKIEVIPSHICPTVNLYDQAYLVSAGQVVEVLPVSCRGRSQ